MKRVYVEGHGCSASFADTEILTGLIESGGYELVGDEEESDIAVLVTCSVKSVTEQRMISRIKELSRNNKRIIVGGCLPKANPDLVKKIDPHLSMIGPENLDKILPALEATSTGRQFVSLERNNLVKLGLPRSRKNSVIGIIEIASGCLSSCTFCQVKLVKGVIFSYPEAEIIREATSLIDSNAKEIWLTSTDNACYGRDTHSSLPSLLTRVCEIRGDFRIRVGMMNPIVTERITQDLIESYHNDKVFQFIHLPVQSGNNRILSLMQRGYTVEDYCEIVELFRREHPSITLATDIIVGFPSETDEEFQDSMELLRNTKPDVVNLSRFGARSGTKAEKMASQVSSEKSKERSKAMDLLIKGISFEKNRRWIGWEGEILIDEIGKNAMIGRNFAYKPCVLKSTEKDSNEMKALLGKRALIKVISATSSTLISVLIPD